MSTYLKWLLFLCLIGSGAQAQLPNSSQNYIRTTTARTPLSTASDFEALRTAMPRSIFNGLWWDTWHLKSEVIQYLDGLGRPIQTIDWRSSPQTADIVAIQQYDKFGRETRAYLPYNQGLNEGGFTPTTSAHASQQQFYRSTPKHINRRYATTPYPYAETQFEASPLNRVVEQGAPGNHWQLYPNSPGTRSTQEHGAIQVLEINDAPVIALRTNDQGEVIRYVYPTNTLQIQVQSDENGQATRIYTNKLGQKLLSVADVSGSQTATTAYAYDLFGRVTHIIQPEGWKRFLTEASSVLANATSLLDQFTFQYTYDSKGQVLAKKVPGADWVYIVYDQRGRIRFTQDGAQRNTSPSTWSFTSYDALDRPIITGLLTGGRTRQSLESYVSSPITQFPLSETRAQQSFHDQTGAQIKGYTHGSYPLAFSSDVIIHSITYYDDYDFDGNGAADMQPQDMTDSRLPDLSAEVSLRTQGLVTGVRLRVLNPDTDMPDWLWTLSWYDAYQRAVITWSENHLKKGRSPQGWLGSWDRTQHNYNFADDLVSSFQLHITDQSSPHDPNNVLLHRAFDYTHRGLPTQTREAIARGQAPLPSLKTISRQSYNDIGQVSQKTTYAPSGLPLQIQDQSYNIRGWLTHINDIGASNMDKQLSVELNSITYTITHGYKEGEKVVIVTYEDDKLVHATDIGTGQTETLPSTARRVKWYEYEWRQAATYTGTINFAGEIFTPATAHDQQEMIRDRVVNHVLANHGNVRGLESLTPLVSSLLFAAFQRQVDYRRDLFAMRLGYESSFGPNGSSPSNFNGNISSIEWRSVQEGGIQTYHFDYDKLNRLTHASYGKRQSPAHKHWQDLNLYNTSYSYDLNGNILTLSRYGDSNVPLTRSNTYTPVRSLLDQLTYTYQGNRLHQVRDAVPSHGSHITDQFIDGHPSGTDYAYDASGNLTVDHNKGFSFNYNHLNKPISVQKGSKLIYYIYSADGTKLRQQVFELDPIILVNASTDLQAGLDGTSLKLSTDYVGSFHFEDPDGAGSAATRRLTYLNHPMGRVVFESTQSYWYEFHYRDHLGNTRLAYREDPEWRGRALVLDVFDYYPFGLSLTDAYNRQRLSHTPYLYNGKELQNELGLGWYDYGARMYDPTIGRWNGVDALAEDIMQLSKSPFAYAWNNPINFTDPDGNCPECVLRGIVRGAKNTVKGLVDAVTHPIETIASVGILLSTQAPGIGLFTSQLLSDQARISLDNRIQEAATTPNGYYELGGEAVFELTAVLMPATKISKTKFVGKFVRNLGRKFRGELTSKKYAKIIEKDGPLSLRDEVRVDIAETNPVGAISKLEKRAASLKDVESGEEFLDMLSVQRARLKDASQMKKNKQRIATFNNIYKDIVDLAKDIEKQFPAN